MSEKHDLEFNKVAAGILFAGVLAMICTFIADGLYTPSTPEKPVFAIDVPEVGAGGAAVAAAPEVPIAELMATADAARGEALVNKKCTACHSFEAGGPNKVGPNLHDTFGGDVGHHPGYPYSAAVQAIEGKWDYEKLNHWLTNPQSFAKGSKMVLKNAKPAERADIIKYLESIK